MHILPCTSSRHSAHLPSKLNIIIRDRDSVHTYSYGLNRYACINKIINQTNEFIKSATGNPSVPDTKARANPADELGPAVVVTRYRKRVRNNNGRSPTWGRRMTESLRTSFGSFVNEIFNIVSIACKRSEDEHESRERKNKYMTG